MKSKTVFKILVLAAVAALTMVLATPAWASESLVGSSNSVRIHVLPFNDTDAIIVESDGHFGVVDSGEDSDYPDGKNARYPLRQGITKGLGHEDEVIAYMKSIGVTCDNLDFYIGTHPHSDHIGSADEIIYAFQPKSIYSPYYDDTYITDSAKLWDNLYVYDHLVAAAQWTEQTYGARFIQHLDPDYSESADTEGTVDLSGQSTESASVNSNTGSPCFTLGSAKIEILNYDEDYRITGVPDANYYSYGVKVIAPGGRTAFLAGDINNYTDGDGQDMGDETKLSMVLRGVDFLKMGHHGRDGSNTSSYLKSILRPAGGNNRAVVVQTGRYDYMPYDTVQALNSVGARHYTAASVKDWGQSAFVVALDADGLKTNIDGARSIVQVRNASPYAVSYQAGLPFAVSGWMIGTDGRWYYFGDELLGQKSTTALENVWATFQGNRVYVNEKGQITKGWKLIGGSWYLFSDSGTVRTGWQKVSGKWYYLEADGTMATGWKKLDDNWYFLDRSSGAMVTGSENIDGKVYLFTNDGSLVSGKGWLRLDGEWYYLNDGGNLCTGWLKLGDVWYWLQPDTGIMATGWELIDNTWYHMKTSGAMESGGWKKIGGVWYYLNKSGAMATGWKKLDGTWYYLSPVSGAMKTGWLDDNGTWYYLNKSGAMATGWKRVGGVWYYLNKSGAMATGWKKLNGSWYYLNPESGAMVTGTHVIDGKSYSFKSSGAMR